MLTSRGLLSIILYLPDRDTFGSAIYHIQGHKKSAEKRIVDSRVSDF